MSQYRTMNLEAPAADQRGNPPSPTWSVVIPAYNEADRLPQTLQEIDQYASRHPGGRVIVVDDGSTDRTPAIIEEFPKSSSYELLIRRHPTNRGKGAAVQTGMANAQGKWVLFMDADSSVSINEVELLVPHLEFVPIVIGSKYLDPSADTHQQALERTLIARLGNLLTHILFALSYRDTQCGFKLFRTTVAHKLFPLLTIDRWAFDVELLVLARRFGYGVREIPIRWQDTDDSRVSILPAVQTSFKELLKIRLNLWQGHYPKAERVVPQAHLGRQ